MPATAWKADYTLRAREIWAEYQRSHDISGLTGWTAGIRVSSPGRPRA